jgi:hypothetical protein
MHGSKVEVTAPLKKALLSALSERDETAAIVPQSNPAKAVAAT